MGPGGQIGATPSGPVIATLITGMTARQRSVGGLVRWLAGHRIEQSDIRRQRKRDAHEPVLDQIGKVAGVVAVHPEVVGIHRPEQGVVRVLVDFALGNQRLEPGARGRRRELKAVRRHMTVGTRASVAAEGLEISVVECRTPARHLVARPLLAVELGPTVVLRLPHSAACAREDDRQHTPDDCRHDPLRHAMTASSFRRTCRPAAFFRTCGGGAL